jgi:hypothetical protein
VDYATLATAALAHLEDGYYYGAYCGKCKHAVHLSLVKLRAKLGDDFPVMNVRGRLRCRLCGSRRIIVTFLRPDQRGGSLSSLFEVPVA